MRSLRETATGVGYSIPGMALVAALDGTVAFASGASRAALLVSVEDRTVLELEGRKVPELIPGIEWPETVGEDLSSQTEVFRDNGSSFHARVTRRKIEVDGTGLFVILIEDLSGQVRARHEADALRWRLDESERLTGLGTWNWDVRLDRVVWSDQLFRVFGLEPGEVEPSVETYLSFIHPDDREEVVSLLNRASSAGLPLNHTKRALRADGTEFTVEVEGTLVSDHKGKPIHLYGVCGDATARWEANLDRARLQALMEASFDGIMAMDTAGRIVAWSPEAERIFRIAARDVLGKTTADFLREVEHVENEVLLKRLSSGESSGMTFETTRTRPDGSEVEVSIALGPVHDTYGEMVGSVAVIRDITDVKRLGNGQGSLETSRDPLTGALSRGHFQALIERVRTDEGGPRSGAVLHFDLDNFKFVNDAYGYAFGDRVLAGITRTIERECPGGAPPARIGGDEFAVLLPGVDEPSAVEWADRMLKRIRGYVEPVEGRPLTTTVSIGICVFSADDEVSVSQIMSRANRALSEAKDRGRDSWILASADEQPGDDSNQLTWETRIRNALAEDLFELYLQPIISVETREIAMYEVLVRMVEGEEVIAPSPFLGVAERIGLIHEIDRMVMRKSLTLLERHPGLRLSVNVSGKSFGDSHMLGMMRERMNQHGFDPCCLVIEVTETAAVVEIERAREFAATLTELGCGFALDDFGTGFGSYAYLKNLPAEYLKIDGEFVSGQWSRIDEMVIKSMVSLAGGLGKKTVAEYVEAEETLDRLRAVGVDFAQGYHIGRPAPADEVLGR